MKKKSVLALALLFSTVGTQAIGPISSVYADEKDKVSEIKDSISKEEKSIKDTKEAYSKLQDEITQNTLEMTSLMKKEDQLNDRIKETEESIKTLEDVVKSQLRQLQVSKDNVFGDGGYVSAILNAKSLTDVVLRVNSISTLQNRQKEVLDELEEKRASLKSDKEDLIKTKEDLSKKQEKAKKLQDETKANIEKSEKKLESLEKEKLNEETKIKLEKELEAVKVAKATLTTSDSSSNSGSVEPPKELASHIKYNPASYGLSSDGSGDGWFAKFFKGTQYAGQCTEFTDSMMYAIYGLANQQGNGIDITSVLKAKFGDPKVSMSTPSPGAAASGQSNVAEGHTYVVQDVLDNGSILISEQNSPWSGNYAKKPYTWNYRVITKANYENAKTTFYLPKKDPKKPTVKETPKDTADKESKTK